jgi:hypothetical protein
VTDVRLFVLILLGVAIGCEKGPQRKAADPTPAVSDAQPLQISKDAAWQDIVSHENSGETTHDYLNVVAMNWCDNQRNCPLSQAARMKIWGSLYYPHVGDVDLGGFHELKTDDDGNQEKISCEMNGSMQLPIRCIASAVATFNGAELFGANQDDCENGVLWRGTVVARVGGDTSDRLPVGTFLGISGPGQRMRTLYGARYKLLATGDHFHFYSTHLSTDDCSNCRIRGAQEIVRIARERYVTGDLPPIVVGDFNDYASDRTDLFYDDSEYLKVQAAMDLLFDDAGGHSDIMHVWVGKPEAFFGAALKWRLLDYRTDSSVTRDTISSCDACFTPGPGSCEGRRATCQHRCDQSYRSRSAAKPCRSTCSSAYLHCLEQEDRATLRSAGTCTCPGKLTDHPVLYARLQPAPYTPSNSGIPDNSCGRALEACHRRCDARPDDAPKLKLCNSACADQYRACGQALERIQ